MASTGPRSDVILERMMALHPKIIDLTLDRVWRLLEALGNPQERLPPVIHIAGTNGKGSTQAMLRAGLEARGERVHAYTSPHLARFHERIRLSGELISEPALMALLEECESALSDSALYSDESRKEELNGLLQTQAENRKKQNEQEESLLILLEELEDAESALEG